MSNVLAPRGFRPLRMFDGSPVSGAMNKYFVPSGYGTTFAVGDVMQELTTGYLGKAAPGAQMRGVVAQIQFVDPTMGTPRYVTYFPAGQTSLNGADVIVELIDDPRVVFAAQIINSSSVPSTLTTRGKLFNHIDTGPLQGPGLSGEGIDYTTLSTSTGVWRALQPLQRADNDTTSAYQTWEFVPALHDFRVNTGV